MESPPPYMPPKKKSNTGLIVGIVIGAIVLCCIGPIAVIGGLGFWGYGKVKPLIECSATMSVARDAVKDYANAHNGQLPDAKNWMEDVRTYYAKEASAEQSPFKPKPASSTWGCDDGNGGSTGIAFNPDLSGKNMNDVKSDDVVLFEVKSATAGTLQKYEQGHFADSPKLFGKPRGWFLVYMTGEPGLYDESGRFVPMNARTGRVR